MKSLLTSQTEKIEETLWVSLRMFEERKNLLNNLAKAEKTAAGRKRYVEQVKAAVSMLSNMDNAAKILTVCAEIDKLESEADHVMRSAMAILFRDEPDVRQVIKLRTIYELLEGVTDRCEDVANIIEGIVLDNS